MYDSVIRDIRKRCRMAMNGIASASMRAQGLDYKLNFGVSVMQVKEIASRYQQDAKLAEKLWQDGTRELKILATILYPVSELTTEVAERWIHEIPNQEIMEQYCFNLLQFFPEAIPFGVESANDLQENIRTVGYWLLSRCIMTKNYNIFPDLSSFVKVWDDLLSEDVSLRNAAQLFLRNMGRISPDIADKILEKLILFKDSEDLLKKEVYDSLSFEFEFFYNKE